MNEVPEQLHFGTNIQIELRFFKTKSQSVRNSSIYDEPDRKILLSINESEVVMPYAQCTGLSLTLYTFGMPILKDVLEKIENMFFRELGVNRSERELYGKWKNQV